MLDGGTVIWWIAEEFASGIVVFLSWDIFMDPGARYCSILKHCIGGSLSTFLLDPGIWSWWILEHCFGGYWNIGLTDPGMLFW